MTHLRGRGVHIGRHFEIAKTEQAWVECIAVETRLLTKPGKKEHGGGNGEGRRENSALGNILRQ